MHEGRGVQREEKVVLVDAEGTVDGHASEDVGHEH